MKVRLRLNELKKWIKNNTNEKNDCLKELYYLAKKVIKIRYYYCSDCDVFIFQTEDGCLNIEEYNYCLCGEVKIDFFIENERWGAKKDEYYYRVILNYKVGFFEVIKIEEQSFKCDDFIYVSGNYFQTEKQAQKFADDLNKAVTPLFEKAKNGEYDEKD